MSADRDAVAAESAPADAAPRLPAALGALVLCAALAACGGSQTIEIEVDGSVTLPVPAAPAPPSAAANDPTTVVLPGVPATTPPAGPSALAGHVSAALPLAGARIEARCAAGTVPPARSAVDGSFAIDLAQATLPCWLTASGGWIWGGVNELRLHGWAQDRRPVLITPASELLLAHALGETPASVDARAVAPALEPARLAAARSHLDAELGRQAIAPWQGEVLTGDAAAALAARPVFAALADRLAAAQQRLSALVQASVSRQSWQATLQPAASDWTWNLPDPSIVPITPAGNPMSVAKVELGRFLFHDTRLSGNGSSSCASCHRQDKAFSDGLPRSLGSTGEMHPRNAQGLANVVYQKTLTWANPDLTGLEKQMEVPLFGTQPLELAIDAASRVRILEQLAADPRSAAQFAAAFPNQDNVVSWPNVIRAIAAFQRSMLSFDSRFDRSRRPGGAPLSAAEQRGFALFISSTRANCFRCHGDFNFAEVSQFQGAPQRPASFRNTGLFNIGGTGAFPEPNRGLFEFTGIAADMGRFRPPSLRNVAVTAPYMHDGSMQTLEEVLDFYAAGGRNITSGPHAGDGRASPFKDELVKSISLSEQDRADIVAFLKTLTDETFLADPRLSDPFAASAGTPRAAPSRTAAATPPMPR